MIQVIPTDTNGLGNRQVKKKHQRSERISSRLQKQGFACDERACKDNENYSTISSHTQTFALGARIRVA